MSHYLDIFHEKPTATLEIEVNLPPFIIGKARVVSFRAANSVKFRQENGRQTFFTCLAEIPDIMSFKKRIMGNSAMFSW